MNSSRRKFLPNIEKFEKRALMATLSILDFGAIAGDLSDDAPAINSAIVAAQADDTVLVPAGEYRLGSTIEIGKDRITLTGEGPQSILKLMDETYTSGI